MLYNTVWAIPICLLWYWLLIWKLFTGVQPFRLKALRTGLFMFRSTKAMGMNGPRISLRIFCNVPLKFIRMLDEPACTAALSNSTGRFSITWSIAPIIVTNTDAILKTKNNIFVTKMHMSQCSNSKWLNAHANIIIVNKINNRSYGLLCKVYWCASMCEDHILIVTVASLLCCTIAILELASSSNMMPLYNWVINLLLQLPSLRCYEKNDIFFLVKVERCLRSFADWRVYIGEETAIINHLYFNLVKPALNLSSIIAWAYCWAVAMCATLTTYKWYLCLYYVLENTIYIWASSKKTYKDDLRCF